MRGTGIHPSVGKGSTAPSVLFVCMPWATTQRPSIALGILSAICEESGIPVSTFYPNMDMVDRIGFETAGRFSNERALYGLSEHLFAVDLFGREALASDEYLESFSRVMRQDATVASWSAPFRELARLEQLRDETVPAFLEATAERVLAHGPTVLGLTSTFNQVMASLALAARVKKARPGITVIAGGACFDDEMGREYHRRLPGLVDHVFMGEAETSFREFLRRTRAGESTRGIPGVTTVVDGGLELVPGAPVAVLDESPVPNYDDFFAEAERKRTESGKIFNVEYLPFESSRGCWWGQKNHCVFCGINEDNMGFRAKGVDRVVQDLVHLSARYGVTKFTATDWIISRWHCDEFFERMKRLDLDLEIFYEVRADMRKQQILQMKAAGVTHVQPGIESLSTQVLQLMRKGTTAIRHVQFLRWAREIGVHLSYNILAGFPDEQASWYTDMASLIRKLRHLQPPLHNLHFIEMHRFSPLFEDRDRYGVDQHALRADYRFNFPDGVVDPLKIGYFFQFHSNRTVAESSYVPVVRQAIQEWIDAAGERTPPVYSYAIGAGFLKVSDTRQGEGRYIRLSDLHHDVVLLCDEVQTRGGLRRDLARLWPREVAEGALDRVIDELVAGEVLMEEGSHLLTLPIGQRPRSTESLRAYVLGGDADAGTSPRHGESEGGSRLRVADG